MFDDVTRTERGHRAMRRLPYLAGSSVAQAILLALALSLGRAITATVVDGPLVPVKIVRSPLPSLTQASPLPPPRASGPERLPKPRPAMMKTPPRPAALIQPQAEPARLVEPEVDPAPVEKDGPGEGEAGEDGGGDPRGVVGGAAGAATGGDAASLDEAPAYPDAGWRRPEQAQRHCVQESVRIPQELRGFVSGPITVRFAIGRDGAPSAFQVMGSIPDPRIGAAIWQAIRACQWLAGTDAQGRPMKIWVTMPLRFVSG